MQARDLKLVLARLAHTETVLRPQKVVQLLVVDLVKADSQSARRCCKQLCECPQNDPVNDIRLETTCVRLPRRRLTVAECTHVLTRQERRRLRALRRTVHLRLRK